MTGAGQEKPVIVWFRQDLRLNGNRALAAAAGRNAPLIALYVLDETGPRPPGAASRWWLHRSLEKLSESLHARGVRLVFKRGAAAGCLAALAGETGAGAVCFTRAYGGRAAAQEAAVRDALSARGVEVRRYGGGLLFEPEAIATQSGDPYKVFTPFWKACRAQSPPKLTPQLAGTLRGYAGEVTSEALSDWRLSPQKPDWARGFADHWQPGEAGAVAALTAFMDGPADGYARARDLPGAAGTSRLSPHLHLGEIGPAQIWHAVRHRLESGGITQKGADAYVRELGWREFCHHLLHHFGALEDAPLRAEFETLRWRRDEAGLSAWQGGRTGYPVVDAGMRELWTTGWMHNRVRMIAASFLIKHLLIDWRAGERWFWDTLVDADHANNACGWQWVAGSGADAAPFFRVFNPMLQSEKFDCGGYIRRHVPELARLGDTHIHAPWQAPAKVLAEAGVRLGETYPRPIVDHADARARALAAFKAMRKDGD